ELLHLEGHEAAVRSVCFTTDGQRLATGAEDSTVRVWDLRTGLEMLCMHGHESVVNSVCFSRDGRRLASGADDKTVRVWNAQTGACLEVIAGMGDADAVAAGPAGFPWRVVRSGPESLVEELVTRRPLSWLPLPLRETATHPSGRAWAGIDGSYLCLFM